MPIEKLSDRLTREICTTCYGNGYVRNADDDSVSDCNVCDNQGEVNVTKLMEVGVSQRELGE